MRVLNDYICPSGHKNEYFLDNTANDTLCLECPERAEKVRSVPHFALPKNDPGFPGEYSKWAKDRDVKIAAELKTDNS
jgi:hypothetical protein